MINPMNLSDNWHSTRYNPLSTQHPSDPCYVSRAERLRSHLWVPLGRCIRVS